MYVVNISLQWVSAACQACYNITAVFPLAMFFYRILFHRLHVVFLQVCNGHYVCAYICVCVCVFVDLSQYIIT